MSKVHLRTCRIGRRLSYQKQTSPSAETRSEKGHSTKSLRDICGEARVPASALAD